MLKKLMRILGRPEGFGASWLLSMMNVGHGPFTRSVLREVEIKSSDVVLDIGCGGGLLISLIAESAAKVYGVDYSPVSVAKSTAKNRRLVDAGRVEVLEAGAEALPFEDGMFDLVTAFETIYFWPNLVESFRGIRGKLKPGGAFIVACEAVAGKDGKRRKLEDIDPGNFRLFGPAELEGLLREAGFSDIRPLCADKPQWLCLRAEK